MKQKPKNIILIGFMATGKTAVGHILSKKLKMKYVSTDTLIEKKEKCKISTIFKKHGELYFRDLETKALKSLSKKNRHVVACGGGIILRPENRKILRSLGKVIWLKAKPGIINKRLKALHQRPLLDIKSDKERLSIIKRILRARKPVYSEIADRIVDTTKLTITGVANVIASEAKQSHF